MAIAKKKQRFFDVEIPIIKKTTHLYGFDEKEMVGRFINYDLTRTLRGKNALLKLRVKEENDNLIAYPVGLNILSSFSRKMVRKGTDYIEDSFKTKCTDYELIIKPFMVTRRKVSRKVKNAIREKAKEELILYLKNKTSEKIFDELLKNQLQKPISQRIKKIYPLSLCEIKSIELTKPLKKEGQTDNSDSSE